MQTDSTATGSAPDPEELLQEAREYVSQRQLRDYCHVINELRTRGASFREIAEWLTDRGVAADHNAVWRVYSRGMTESERAEAEALAAEEQREEEASGA